MSATSLQEHSSVEELFKHVDTVPLALFDHIDFSFLNEFPVFALDPWGRTGEYEAPELLRGVLYRFSRDIFSPEAIARELQDGPPLPTMWLRQPTVASIDSSLYD